MIQRMRLWKRGARAGAGRRRVRPGVAIVEFALASLLFLPITLGTIDVGRAVFAYSQLHNAVREGARVAKVKPPTSGANITAIQNQVLKTGVGLDMSAGNISASCNKGCVPGTSQATVTATARYTSVVASFINALLPLSRLSSTITLQSTAKVDIE